LADKQAHRLLLLFDELQTPHLSHTVQTGGHFPHAENQIY